MTSLLLGWLSGASPKTRNTKTSSALCNLDMDHDCEDADHDYICDYCGSVLDHGCFDANHDYWCDACTNRIPHICPDTDEDGLCDWCNYLAEESCVDTDQDYFCDTCYRFMAHRCLDEDADDYCDICGEWYHFCTDIDVDGWCEECDRWISHEAVDSNGDTICDWCSSKIGHQCVFDSGYDYCDVCGAEKKPGGLIVLTGVVTSYGDETADVTLELVSVDGEEMYSMTVGSSSGFGFEVACPGVYTLTASKENHVTRSYTVTLGTEPTEQDVTICLIGDIDGNGKINVGDVAKLYSHIRKTAVLTDEYQLLCANVNGGSLNVGDVANIYSHIRGTKKLY